MEETLEEREDKTFELRRRLQSKRNRLRDLKSCLADRDGFAKIVTTC